MSKERIPKKQESSTKGSVIQQKHGQAKSFTPPDSGVNFTVQKKENKTGLPDQLKSGIENLSGVDVSDVKVHYNSSQPAQLNAHAYAQGNQIHIAPGQEKHLAHEAWHVVQQKQGRVKPTKQLKSSVAINDDAGLEKEADVMGAHAAQLQSAKKSTSLKRSASTSATVKPIQGKWNINPAVGFEFQMLKTDIDFGKKEEPKKEEEKSDSSDDDIGFSFGSADKEKSKFEELSENEGIIDIKAGFNHWHIEKDGKNLEFVTDPYAGKGILQTSMADLAKTARYISSLDAPKTLRINKEIIIQVNTTETNGQPQINPDIPLSALSALIEEANHDPVLNPAFSIDGQFGWKNEETQNELKDLAKAANFVNGLNVIELLGIDAPGKEEKAADVKGAVLLLAQAVIHETFYRQQLSKDQPLLHKTHMGHLWRRFFKEGIITTDGKATSAILIAELNKLPIDGMDEAKATISSFVRTTIVSKKDPVWSRDTHAVEIWEHHKKTPKKDQQHFMKQILVELRRVPEVAVTQWPKFAMHWYNYFVDFYKRALPSPEQRKHSIDKEMAGLGKLPARKVGGKRRKGKKK